MRRPYGQEAPLQIRRAPFVALCKTCGRAIRRGERAIWRPAVWRDRRVIHGSEARHPDCPPPSESGRQ